MYACQLRLCVKFTCNSQDVKESNFFQLMYFFKLLHMHNWYTLTSTFPLYDASVNDINTNL